MHREVDNTYSGSLSNLVDGLFGWRPGRFAMVVLGNLIGLSFVAGGILDLVFRSTRPASRAPIGSAWSASSPHRSPERFSPILVSHSSALS